MEIAHAEPRDAREFDAVGAAVAVDGAVVEVAGALLVGMVSLGSVEVEGSRCSVCGLERPVVSLVVRDGGRGDLRRGFGR